jgi:hypothetical protein
MYRARGEPQKRIKKSPALSPNRHKLNSFKSAFIFLLSNKKMILYVEKDL